MKKLLNRIVIWSTSNPKSQWLMIILQISCGSAGVIYTLTNDYKKESLVIFFLSLFIVVVWSVLILVFNKTYGLIVLLLSHETGVLFDKNTKFRNVSLRAGTINTLLNGFLENNIDRNQQLKNTAELIGRDFVNTYNQYLLGDENQTPNEMLNQIMKYDSSSGMGKFEITNFRELPQISIEFCVNNPFTSGNNIDEVFFFFEGYLKGVVESIFGGSFEINLLHVSNSIPEFLTVSAIKKS